MIHLTRAWWWCFFERKIQFLDAMDVYYDILFYSMEYCRSFIDFDFHAVPVPAALRSILFIK